MISGLLIVIAGTLFGTIVALFPDAGTVSSEAQAAISNLANYTHLFNQIIAIDSLWDCLVIMVLFEISLLVITLIRYGLRLIPFFGHNI